MYHNMTDAEIQYAAETTIRQRPEFALVKAYPRHLIDKAGNVLSVVYIEIAINLPT